jgi:hypothetical protein
LAQPLTDRNNESLLVAAKLSRLSDGPYEHQIPQGFTDSEPSGFTCLGIEQPNLQALRSGCDSGQRPLVL